MNRFFVPILTLALTAIALLALVVSGCGTFESDCGDGVDNDVDGWLDCYDTDCDGSELCGDEEQDDDDDASDDDDDD
ncbi:MAG: hypothetical protein QGH45_25005, partial [Myxococcota bacterium]|nr:hypothetical protein [Myxococcota bacterium]